MKQSDIYKLHQKYSHGKYKKEILEIVWTHSLIIKNISLQIADKLEKDYKIKTDKKLITVGALVHDIGFYDCFDDDYRNQGKYVFHGRMGYKILIKEKVCQKKARFALTHVGVGFEKDIPISLEEEIVCYADNFHSKGHPGFNNFEDSLKEMSEINSNYGVILERYKDKFGIPDVKELKEKYKKWHEEINEWVESVR